MKRTTEQMKKKPFVILLGNCFLFLSCLAPVSVAQQNPFLPPGAKSARPPAPVVRQTPIAQKPKPVNPNLELRGIFRYRDVWHFSIHDKVKNKGYWVTSGDSLTEDNIEVESFDEANDVLKLKGGMELELKRSSLKTLPVPGQGKARPIAKKPTPPRPTVKRATFTRPGGMRTTLTIPPRVPARPPTSSGGRVRVVGQK
jgi:hypothetical protein